MTAATYRDRMPGWIEEMRHAAAQHPGSGACAVATAMEVWSWTIDHVRGEAQAGGRDEAPALRGPRATPGGEGAVSVSAHAGPLAEALGWLLSSRAFVLESVKGADPSCADVCHAHTARACGEVGRICAQLVFGSLRHPGWDTDADACYCARDLEVLEEYLPGLTSTARAYSDVIEADGSHQDKAGPCVRTTDIGDFVRLRAKLDGCLAGAHTARVRAAKAIK